MLNKPLFRDWLGISFPSSSEDIPFPLCGCKIDIRKWWMMMVHLWVWVQTPIHPCPDINSSYFLVQFLKYLSSSFSRSAFLLVPANQNKWQPMVDGRGSRAQGPARNLPRSLRHSATESQSRSFVSITKSLTFMPLAGIT